MTCPDVWVGTHKAGWLATAGVPLMVSHRTLAPRFRLPPGCAHRSCANCQRYALRWRDKVLRRADVATLWDAAA